MILQGIKVLIILVSKYKILKVEFKEIKLLKNKEDIQNFRINLAF